MPVIIVPFAIFFAGATSQFWFFRKVRQALIANHPEIYLSISVKAWSVDNAIVRFAFGKEAKMIGDAALSASVRNVRILFFVALTCWLGIAGLAISGLGAWPLAR